MGVGDCVFCGPSLLRNVGAVVYSKAIMFSPKDTEASSVDP